MISERRKGIVLIGVLALIVLLLGVLMDFAYRARVQLDMAENRLNTIRARLGAESALDITRAVLSGIPDMLAPEMETFFAEGEMLYLDDVELRVRLEPESSKINLSDVVSSRTGRRRRGNRLRAQSLFRLADVLNEEYSEPVFTYDMILSILEWITPEGALDLGALPGEPAGSDYYRQKTPPYECKHADLNTISELLLVKGITEEVLYGRKGGGEEPDIPGIAEFLTLYGGSESIEERLGEGTQLEDLRNIEPRADETFLTIDVTAKAGHARHRIRAIVQRRGANVLELCRTQVP